MSARHRYPHAPDPSRASITGRHRAGELAPTSTKAALEAARSCPDAWYRVQALASVAEHAPDALVFGILDEAAGESRKCHDAYGTVAVMSWPIQVAFKRGRISYAERERNRCLALAAEITPRNSQAFALQCLWGGCYIGGPEHAKPVFNRILELCHPDRCWRSRRLYRHIAEVVESRSPGAAIAVMRAMPPGKSKDWLQRRFGLVTLASN